MKKSQILLVDDHPIMRRGIADTISTEDELEICGEAKTADEAITKVEELQPDLAVIDVSLGSRSGLELIQEIRTHHPEVKTLVFSMHSEKLFAERALRAGALGYVNKSDPGSKLLEAIRTVLDGRFAVSPAIAEHFIRRGLDQTPKKKTGVESLSDREMEIFQLIGQGQSVKEIAEILHLSAKTIETHREHIKTKLGLGSSTELIRYAAVWMESP